MSKQNHKYRLLKGITIFLGGLMVPWGTYVGYQLGTGNTQTALIALGAQTVMAFTQTWFWWKTFDTSKGQI